MDEITITHFVNPHSFWYKKKASVQENVEIKKMELEICEYVGKNPSFSAPKSMRVLVRYLPFNRWIRGEVFDVQQFLSESYQYIVWAVDYGFPFITAKKFIRPMPEQFGTVVSQIRFGGLANIVPAEMEFDSHRISMVRKKKWCERALKEFGKICKDSFKLSFDEHYISGERTWGELHAGIENVDKLSQMLVDLNCGLAVDPKTFRNICDHWVPKGPTECLKKMSNIGYKKNVLSTKKDDSMTDKIVDHIAASLLKVENWRKSVEMVDKHDHDVVSKVSISDIEMKIDFNDSFFLNQLPHRRGIYRQSRETASDCADKPVASISVVPRLLTYNASSKSKASSTNEQIKTDRSEILETKMHQLQLADESAPANDVEHAQAMGKSTTINEIEKSAEPYISPFEDMVLSEAPTKYYDKVQANVLPAGFDLSRLFNYRDKNHWHIRKSINDDNE